MSRPLRVLTVVGTRPNIMKMAPVVAALRQRPDDFVSIVVHTGQHYDEAMSQVFIDELGLGTPDRTLEIGPGSHAQQTARVMERLEPILLEARPDVMLVPGDVNSTLAAALTAVKLGVLVGHVEAGLRSFDRTMPEEVNRVLVDQVADLLFTHSPEARPNLEAEGRAGERVHYVGNTMIDTLVVMRERIAGLRAAAVHGLEDPYLVVTLHRPALVDTPLLADAMSALAKVAREMRVVFPVHPRTRAALHRRGIVAPTAGLDLLEPLGYLEFLSLVTDAAGVLTDSGGIQEETTFLGVPCFTLRETTERPITCQLGTNVLLGLHPERIADVPALIRSSEARSTSAPPLWDGQAGPRVADVLSALG